MFFAGSFGGRSATGGASASRGRCSADLVDPVFDSFEGIHLRRSPPDAAKSDGLRADPHRGGAASRRTMSVGADRVGEAISEARRKGETSLSGQTVFRFYDTYGVPLELIEELAQDEGVHVDRDGLREASSAWRASGARELRSSKADERPPADELARSLLDDGVPRLSRGGFRPARGREGARLCFLTEQDRSWPRSVFEREMRAASLPTARSSTRRGAARSRNQGTISWAGRPRRS